MAAYLAERELVCVIWKDTNCAVIGDYSIEDAIREFHKDSIYHSFGLLIHEDKEAVMIMTDFAPAGSTYRGMNRIPREMVVEIISLGRPARKTRRTKAVPAAGTSGQPGNPQL